MPVSDEEKWQQRYREQDAEHASPALVLRSYAYLLPESGKALDLAAGLGANARFLAHRGLEAHAWDRSAIAMEKLATIAHKQGLPLQCEVRDVIAQPPPPDRFDVIVVSRFLERSLCPHICTALKPGGLLYYQTFLLDKTQPDIGPSNPAYLLEQNELLRLFQGLIVRAYHEEGAVGDPGKGIRNEALLVAQRPAL